MAKPPRRKRPGQAFPPPTASEPSPAESRRSSGNRPMRWDLIAIFLLISIGGTYLAVYLRPTQVPRYTWQLLTTFPHDPDAFTQGFEYDDGTIWESTGRYGTSTLRQVDLQTGEILRQTELADDLFGEGCTRWKDTIVQLTWKERKILVYDLELNPIGEHTFDRDGWGLTNDGRSLIVSDGTSTLRFLNPETFRETHSVVVRDDRSRIGSLNELAFVNGKVLANQWKTDLIYEIDPQSGIVESVIDLSGLWPARERPEDGVLNGIAFNTRSKRLLVTGKLCPSIFEIQLERAE